MILIAALVAAWGPAIAQEITGAATAYDSDKIMIDGQRILIWGIDAVDGDQSCRLEGRTWDCWAVAHRALQILVDQRNITCQRVDEPEVYGRTWGICSLGDLDVGEEMVRSGMAFAYRPQTDRYVAAEDSARTEASGLWRSQFAFPWEWRDQFDRGEGNR